MHVSEAELKEFIADSGLVARKDIDEAAREAESRSESIGAILVSRGHLTEDGLRRIHSYVLGIPFVHLTGERIPHDVLSLIPEPIARTKSIIAYKKEGGNLHVALLDTRDLPAIESVRLHTGLTIQPRLTDVESVRHALLQYQKTLKDEFGTVIATEAARLAFPSNGTGEYGADELKSMAEDLPIVRIVDALLRHAIVQRASDIHIEPLESEVLVRYRIDGTLHDAMRLPKSAATAIAARIKVLADLKIEERRLPQDGRFVMETEADRVSFRVSLLPTLYGEKAVMRLLRETGEGFTLDALGFHGEGLERIHAALRQKSGLILICGPAGSGKTTTLYTMLDILNTPHVTISTIEHPVEYQIKRVNQTQVSPDIGFTFANGVRALLRQDPDILMIGEISDGETAVLAVNAALSGRLVLATMPGEGASSAITRLIDMGVDPFLLASTLRTVISQRLVRKLADPKEAYATTRAERTNLAPAISFDSALAALREEKLVKPGTGWDDIPLYRPQQSEENGDGYKNRLGIYEVLSVSPAIRERIIQSSDAKTIEEQAKKEGMLTLREDGIYQAARGMTSLEEVLGAVRK